LSQEATFQWHQLLYIETALAPLGLLARSHFLGDRLTRLFARKSRRPAKRDPSVWHVFHLLIFTAGARNSTNLKFLSIS